MKILETIGKIIMLVFDVFLLLMMILLFIWSMVELTKSVWNSQPGNNPVRYDHTSEQDSELECEIIGG